MLPCQGTQEKNRGCDHLGNKAIMSQMDVFCLGQTVICGDIMWYLDFTEIQFHKTMN
jgi:hypothetical protein